MQRQRRIDTSVPAAPYAWLCALFFAVTTLLSAKPRRNKARSVAGLGDSLNFGKLSGAGAGLGLLLQAE